LASFMIIAACTSGADFNNHWSVIAVATVPEQIRLEEFNAARHKAGSKSHRRLATNNGGTKAVG
jgi:hypothetical protein